MCCRNFTIDDSRFTIHVLRSPIIHHSTFNIQHFPRATDLNGSVGMFRLKEELTKRVNAAISPSQVNAVLFKEMLVQ